MRYIKVCVHEQYNASVGVKVYACQDIIYLEANPYT